MQELLERNIKELIKAHPALESILNGFDIGCTACSLGTCRLRDIVEIHNLDEAGEKKLFTLIAESVFPGQPVAIPKLNRKPRPLRDGKAISPPIRELVDEHVHIKKVIAAVRRMAAQPRAGLPESGAVLLRALDFIRNYADRFHHAKEEDLLFKLFDADSDIIQAMLREHETGRSHVRSARAAIEAGRAEEAGKNLLAYADLLSEHIHKEDDILYPWMNRELSDSQVGRLFTQFSEVAVRFGDGPAEDVKFADGLS